MRIKTIIITGPSGSGKTILTQKLLEVFDDSIVLKTDSYYRDNLLIKLLSIFKNDIYDRIISIKKNDIKKTISSIYGKKKLIYFFHYDFMKKKSLKSKIKLNFNNSNQFVIIEGIFSHRLDLNYQETINIICEEKKEICYDRRIKRDQSERGRKKVEVNKKFNKSWFLFYKNIHYHLNNKNAIILNPTDLKSFNKLVLYLKTKKNN